MRSFWSCERHCRDQKQQEYVFLWNVRCGYEYDYSAVKATSECQRLEPLVIADGVIYQRKVRLKSGSSLVHGSRFDRGESFSSREMWGSISGRALGSEPTLVGQPPLRMPPSRYLPRTCLTMVPQLPIIASNAHTRTLGGTSC